jgi:hypothetical protein
MVRKTRLIHCASKRASLIRDLAGGFPLGPAAITAPHKQAGHMKATDQTHLDNKALAIRGAHMNHITARLGILNVNST